MDDDTVEFKRLPVLGEEELAAKLSEWNRRPHLLEQEECSPPNEGCTTTLTEEELVELALGAAQDRLRLMLRAPQPGPNDAALVLALVDQAQDATSRLIVALRAKDEEIAALKQERDNWKADYEEMHHSEFGY